ncbi:MAG: MotA/TolQ/ExbB proton channel family protein, partial [Gammaproteobacteria bacterium]|nr:MotA/TolQ/ExbB proton channel family protein [Gammaproteobacteria bacterium]
MVGALSGVFASTIINSMAERERELLQDHLTMDH